MTKTNLNTPVDLTASPSGVAVVTLNIPAKKNAFSAATIEALHQTFITLRAQDNVRLVFLRGAGGMFSAGADLEWMKAAADYTEAENRQDAMALSEMLRALHELPQATCALVEGAAMGGGAGLVAACDMTVAVTGAKFAFSEARLGLTPATISPFVIQAIGPRWARALFTTAQVFGTELAHHIGLVTQVVDDVDGLHTAMATIEKQVTGCAPGAVADCKALVADVTGQDIDHDIQDLTAKRIAHRRATAEGREGIDAFLNKRKPTWVKS